MRKRIMEQLTHKINLTIKFKVRARFDLFQPRSNRGDQSLRRTNNSCKPHSKWTSLGIRCTTKADPNTMLRIAVSFILYKAGPIVSVQGISDSVACQTFVLVWFKVACRNVFHRIVHDARQQARTIIFSDQNSATKG